MYGSLSVTTEIWLCASNPLTPTEAKKNYIHTVHDVYIISTKMRTFEIYVHVTDVY